MDLILETELCFNKQEVDFANGFGIEDIPSSHIFVIENCRKKERRNMTDGLAETIQEEIAVLKNKYPEKVVLNIMQFKKGMPKTDRQIKSAIKCNNFEGTDGVCLYENNPLQEVQELENKLPDLINLAEENEIYFVLEIDGGDILEKVNLLLNTGIKNFILIAGKYNDEDLWRQVIVSSILANEGKAIVLLPARMNTRTGKSFIEKVESYGATIVVHGLPFGGGKPKNTKYLDKTDMYYKDKSLLPETHTIISDRRFSDLYDAYEGNLKKEYKIGRVCSLIEGRLFCEANRRQITLDT